MPTDKIGVYTRFFQYANFRLPLSTFLVNVLRYYHINISQLSVIAAAKVSHFEIFYRVHGFEPTVGLFRFFYVNSKNKGWMSFSKRQGSDAVCYTKPLDSLKGWNDHFFWVDSFACHASFSRHTGKNVSKDPFPKSSEFNADHYDTLVAYPAPFQKYPEPFLCLVGMNRNYTLCEDTYPRFLHDSDEGGCLLLLLICVLAFDLVFDCLFVCVKMDLLAFIQTVDPTKVKVVAPDHAESELEASVDRLFEEGGSDTVVEDVAPLQPRRQRKQKTVVVDAGESSHPAKNLREDHGTPIRGEAIPTLLFVTSSVSATPEREGGDHTDFVAGTNLRTVSAPQRSSVPIMSAVTTVTSTVDHALTAKEKTVAPSLFVAGSSSAGGTEPITGGFSDLTGSDFLIGGIRTIIDLDTDIQKVYVPQWSVTNGSRLEDGRVCREMVEEFAHPSAEVRMSIEYNIREKRRLKSVVEERAELLKVREKEVEDLKAHLLLKEAEATEAIRLRGEASKFEAIKKSLQDEVQALKERNTSFEKECDALDVKVTELETSAISKDRELTDLNAQLTSVKSHNDNLVHQLEMSSSRLQEKLFGYEHLMERLEEFQDAQLKNVNDRVVKLVADLAEMACHLEEKIYPHLLMTISGQRWLLTHGLKLVLIKCLNSSEYLTALGAAISRAVEKGMHDGLATGIDYGREGRSLTDIATYNPFAGADYTYALQELCEPDIEQLKIPIHRSEDQLVLGETSLSFALSVSHSRVERIRANIAVERVPVATITTTALSTTFASTSSIPPITVYDYEIAHTDISESS
ncbi:hypothetical protein Tco_0017646 [Tanacetum coccineum]